MIGRCACGISGLFVFPDANPASCSAPAGYFGPVQRPAAADCHAILSNQSLELAVELIEIVIDGGAVYVRSAARPFRTAEYIVLNVQKHKPGQAQKRERQVSTPAHICPCRPPGKLPSRSPQLRIEMACGHFGRRIGPPESAGANSGRRTNPKRGRDAVVRRGPKASPYLPAEPTSTA